MSAQLSDDTQEIAPARNHLVYKQRLATRITHWIWAFALFFLLLSGLQIFNAHPTLYVGDQSGFEFDNTVLSMTAEDTDAGPKGTTTIFGFSFDTSGVLGMSKEGGEPTPRGFPAWATIPSTQDLATGRVVHFFFAWVLVATLIVWLVFSLINGHLWHDIVPGPKDIRALPKDILNHVRLRFHHTRRYNTLQKLTYAAVLLLLFPVMIYTGLCMSPGMNAFAPGLFDILRPANRAHHPFLHDGRAGCLLHHPHHHGLRGRTDQRNALDDHRLVSKRPIVGRRNRTGGEIT